MDRKLYLEMMRRCAVMPRGIHDIVKDVPDDLRVVWRGIEYYPQAYTLEDRQDGSIAHTCRLHDLEANAVVGAPLHEVKAKMEALDGKEKQSV